MKLFRVPHCALSKSTSDKFLIPFFSGILKFRHCEKNTDPEGWGCWGAGESWARRSCFFLILLLLLLEAQRNFGRERKVEIIATYRERERKGTRRERERERKMEKLENRQAEPLAFECLHCLLNFTQVQVQIQVSMCAREECADGRGRRRGGRGCQGRSQAGIGRRRRRRWLL